MFLYLLLVFPSPVLSQSSNKIDGTKVDGTKVPHYSKNGNYNPQLINLTQKNEFEFIKKISEHKNQELWTYRKGRLKPNPVPLLFFFQYQTLICNPEKIIDDLTEEYISALSRVNNIMESLTSNLSSFSQPYLDLENFFYEELVSAYDITEEIRKSKSLLDIWSNINYAKTKIVSLPLLLTIGINSLQWLDKICTTGCDLKLKTEFLSLLKQAPSPAVDDVFELNAFIDTHIGNISNAIISLTIPSNILKDTEKLANGEWRMVNGKPTEAQESSIVDSLSSTYSKSTINNQLQNTEHRMQSTEPFSSQQLAVGSWQLPNYQITKLPNHHQPSATSQQPSGATNNQQPTTTVRTTDGVVLVKSTSPEKIQEINKILKALKLKSNNNREILENLKLYTEKFDIQIEEFVNSDIAQETLPCIKLPLRQAEMRNIIPPLENLEPENAEKLLNNAGFKVMYVKEPENLAITNLTSSIEYDKNFLAFSELTPKNDVIFCYERKNEDAD